MERIFHLDQIRNAQGVSTHTAEEKVSLRRQHLILAAEIAQNAFGKERQVYAVYYDNLGMLLLAPMSDELFKQAHECSLLMLKDRSIAGDKSISLQELFLDHEIDHQDRALTYTSAPGLKMLQVQLKPLP